MHSRSVKTSLLLQRGAKKKTVATPLNAMLHQSQLPATPWRETSSVTARGVSAAKVVATIEVPASHQGSFRSETKKSARVLFPLPARYNPSQKKKIK